MNKSIFIVILTVYSYALYAKQPEGLTAKFSFNHGNTKNETTSGHASIVGATLTEDRFGNEASAYYLHGSNGSYINLGTDTSLKPVTGTVSLWLKLDNIVYSGKGYDGNPIIITKSNSGNDFYEAYSMTLDMHTRRLSSGMSYVNGPDTLQAGLRTKEALKTNRWYHVAMVYSDSFICLYLDGELQNKTLKNFKTSFLAGDSVIIGYSANKKNVRYFNGAIDDIQIYKRLLPEEEIRILADAPDPNKNHYIIKSLVIVVVCIAGLFLLVLLLLKREKNRSRKQRQVYEMEMQIMRAQMNPHFIFNAINSVQQFILEDDNENASKYLVKFARLLRMILESTREDNITLAREIDILTKYIEIEALRFEGSFSYEVMTDAGINVQALKIPQMLIQPLVENAIWHGLLPKKENRHLSLKFEQPNAKELVCIIEDNGVGRKAQRQGQRIPGKISVAMNLIQQRLELMRKEWKHEYTMRIIDKDDPVNNVMGTCVILNLPILN